VAVGMFGAVGTTSLFACIAFAVWIDYRRKKDERDAAHAERMRALELGHPPPDADIERAKAYASAAWAAGLIGLLVPLAVLFLTFVGTLVAVLSRQTQENITAPLIVAWSIAAVVSLVTSLRGLSAIRQLPRPGGEQVSGPTTLERQKAVSHRFQEQCADAEH
jgi:hypothetical protein